MTGTASEVARELWNVYSLEVEVVPTNRPIRRRRVADRIFLTDEKKWRAVTKIVRQLHEKGVPVLIGCRTVADSMAASSCLAEAGLRHSLLNAEESEKRSRDRGCGR
ncbi:hypothetical protein QW131_31900 [Roseibium salinum]|nr:hypothetical protein [Roseibium salinum]